MHNLNGDVDCGNVARTVVRTHDDTTGKAAGTTQGCSELRAPSVRATESGGLGSVGWVRPRICRPRILEQGPQILPDILISLVKKKKKSKDFLKDAFCGQSGTEPGSRMYLVMAVVCWL